MEAITIIKNLKISPKKLRFYLDTVKKMTPDESLKKLYYGKQKATKVLYEAINQAVNNAKQTLKVTTDLLNFKLLTIDGGQVLKRYRPGSRGNANPIKKRMSHIKIVLESKAKDKIAHEIMGKKEEKIVNNDKSKNSDVKKIIKENKKMEKPSSVKATTAKKQLKVEVKK